MGGEGTEKGEKKGEGKGMKGKEGKDFRAFPQFQICHYTTGHDVFNDTTYLV